MFLTSGGRQYRQLKPSEAHYESIVLQLSPLAFPGWDAHRWKKRVFTPDGRGSEPDLILLSHDSYDWAVVEVELDHHSIAHHIDDQLDRLSRATYGQELVESFAAVGVDREDAREFLRRRPSMLCVVDGGSLRIHDCCQAHGFDMAVLIPYVNELGQPALDARSIPGQYRNAPETDAGLYVLRRSADTVFGKPALNVPDSFPDGAEFRLRWREADYMFNVTVLGGRRITFLPDGMDPRIGTGLRVATVDVENRLFQLLGEETGQ